MGIVVNRTRLNPFPIKSASGDFISIDDAVDRPVKKLEINFTPKQSFNGYDYPWVGGANKNKFDVDNANWKNGYYLDAEGVEQSGTAYKYTQAFTSVLPSTQYAIQMNKITAVQAALTVCEYDENQTFIQRNVAVSSTITTGVLSGTFTTTETTKYIRFSAPYSSSASESGSYHFQLETGSSATEWSPYANICPITGYTGLTVADDSRYAGFVDWNQYADSGLTNFGTNRASVSTEGNVTTVTCTSNTSALKSARMEFPVDHKLLVTASNYTTSVVGSGVPYIGIYSGGGGIEYSTRIYPTLNAPIADVIDVDHKYESNRLTFGFATSCRYGSTISMTDLQIFDLTQMFGVTVADQIFSMEQSVHGSGVAWFRSIFSKEPYPYSTSEITCASAVNGDPYWIIPVSWETEAGTVYGGTLNLISGVLSSEYKIVTPSGCDTGTVQYARYVLGSFGYADASVKAYSNMLIRFAGTASQIPTGCFMLLNSSGYNRSQINFCFVGCRGSSSSGTRNLNDQKIQELRDAGTPLQFVFKLTAPISYQLTPHQVSTLMGSNRIWTDVGTISLDYRVMRSAQNTPLLGGMLGNPSVPEEPEVEE